MFLWLQLLCPRFMQNNMYAVVSLHKRGSLQKQHWKISRGVGEAKNYVLIVATNDLIVELQTSTSNFALYITKILWEAYSSLQIFVYGIFADAFAENSNRTTLAVSASPASSHVDLLSVKISTVVVNICCHIL